MIQKLSLCVLALMVSSVFCAPGVKLKGNSMMIKLVKDAVVSFVQQNAALDFNDMTEMQELGNETYTYNLINTELASVDFNGAAKITALYPRTLAFHTTTLTIVLSGTYQVRLANSIVEDGPFTITFSDSNVVTHIELTNVDDFLAATATNCWVATKPGVLDVDGLSPGHLKSLKYTVEQNLNSNSLNTVVCSTLRTYLGQSVNTFFTTRLGGLPIISTIKMDASLYGQPIVGRNSLQVAVSGKCYPGNDSSISYPYLRTALHDFTSSDQMLKVMVGKYTIETLLSSLHASGLLTLTPQQIQGFVSFTLTTSLLGLLIPGFYLNNAFGNQVNLQLSVLHPPAVDITPTGITLMGIMNIQFIVEENGIPIEALSLYANMTLFGNVRAVGHNVTAEITSVQYSLEVNRSIVGQVSLGGIKIILDGVIQNSALPAINSALQGGFSIPTIYGFTLNNLVITSFQDSVEMAGDIVGSLVN